MRTAILKRNLNLGSAMRRSKQMACAAACLLATFACGSDQAPAGENPPLAKA